MRNLLFLLVVVLSASAFAQSSALGKNYFERGDYEKALAIFKKLVRQNPNRTDFSTYLIKSHQQLENFEEAERWWLHKLNNMPWKVILLRRRLIRWSEFLIIKDGEYVKRISQM